MRIFRKADLDTRAADKSGLPLRDVRLVTSLFLDALKELIATGEPVQLSSFGEFHLSEEWGLSPVLLTHGTLTKGEGRTALVRSPVKRKIHFKKSRPFKRFLEGTRPGGKESVMEKFGVDTTGGEADGGEKRASGDCPSCGASALSLVKQGSVTICPNCGTAPFETKAPSRSR